MTLHADQIASVLRRAVQSILARGLNDPRIKGLVSVTRVELTDDFSQANVFVSIMPAEHAEMTMHGLRSATAHVRTQVGRSVKLRRMPRLVFRLDHSLKKQAAILSAIEKARRGDEQLRGSDADGPGPEDTTP